MHCQFFSFLTYSRFESRVGGSLMIVTDDHIRLSVVYAGLHSTVLYRICLAELSSRETGPSTIMRGLHTLSIRVQQ